MGKWEKQLLDRPTVKPFVFVRCIDNIFGVWVGTMEKLLEFNKVANSIYENIKVDLRTSTTEIEYVDVNVRKVGTKFISDL